MQGQVGLAFSTLGNLRAQSLDPGPKSMTYKDKQPHTFNNRGSKMESPRYLKSIWTPVGDVSAQDKKRDTNPNQTKEIKPSVDVYR